MREHAVDACAHFAAFAYVGESVSEPASYYENNFTQAAVLFETLARAGVKHVVFSSTCATYGVPRQVPIPEDHPQWPINPYGWSKLFVERLLADFDRAYGLRFVALRYFNAAGASARCGEAHDPETHLSRSCWRWPRGGAGASSCSAGTTTRRTARRSATTSTSRTSARRTCSRSRTCAAAARSQFLNLGNGLGYSVLEVIESARRVTGRDVAYEAGPRREGDPPRLVGDADEGTRAARLGPERPELEDIIRSAWEWLQAHPNGY